MGVPEPIRSGIRQTVCSPVIGQLLYKLNTLPSVLRFMYRQHVYTDDRILTPEFMHQRYRLTQQPGGRYAPAAFVTGMLDPVSSQEEFLHGVDSVSVPLMMVIGDDSPPASKAEMEAIAALPAVQDVHHIPGSLGLYKECAAEIANMIVPFLDGEM